MAITYLLATPYHCLDILAPLSHDHRLENNALRSYMNYVWNLSGLSTRKLPVAS
jgi:hypothetical protein